MIKRICSSLFILFAAFQSFAMSFEISDLKWVNDVGAKNIPSPDKIFNVSEYGAVGNGTKINTKEIQAAVDACCNAGGGKVTFPTGEYLTGSVYLKNGVILEIPEGVTILGSTDINDYPVIETRIAGVEMKWPSALINVLDCDNVMITGKGIIDGQGKIFWDKYWEMRRDYEARGLRWIVDYDCDRPRTILVSESENVTIKDINIRQAGFWTMQLLYYTYCTVDGVVIRNNINGRGPSTDGIDIDSSTKILIENCDVDCNDDNYCLKAGRDADGIRVNRPTEFVVIRNCISRAGGGLITCGSETSGGIRNILMYDCKAIGTGSGLMLKSALTRGGGIENIYLKNIEMDGVRSAFTISVNWNPSYSYSTLPEEFKNVELPVHWNKMLTPVSPEKGLPYIKGVYLSDINVSNAGTAFPVEGTEDAIIAGIHLDNVKVQSRRGGRITFAKDWSVKNLELYTEERLRITNAEGVEINDK